MVSGQLVAADGGQAYRIDGVQDMDPFLMTVVSDTDLWMFVTSNGVPTAGRVNADHALFPYETDDRLERNAGVVGPVTVVARTIDGTRELWRPFGREVDPGCTRALAKGVQGDHVTFEERNPTWGLVFRATWAPSDRHGWVRTVELVDDGGGAGTYELLDGLLDVMPAGVDALTEQIRSNLINAYKRSETGPWGTLAVFSLESLLSDRAEPMEALTATTIWSWGLEGASIDLDSHGVAAMLADTDHEPSALVTGRAGAYLLRGSIELPTDGAVAWGMVADTNLDHADVAAVVDMATRADAVDRVADDIAAGSARLHDLLAAADGFQSTGDAVVDAHHLSNVLFNSMRGGVFPFGHRVPTAALAEFVAARNADVRRRHDDWFAALATEVDVTALREAALAVDDPDLLRLVLAYLPLTFSRRHGDPSRPWNRFSINVRDDAGEQVLAYEGNWRDIFQNWEALLQSYPAYLVNVVTTFLNASTIDGFNPYRISQDGIDWEVPDPDDPWSHIGYWGDHQIIYLLRLLETWVAHEPAAISDWLDRPVFTFADVPYRLADHDEMVADPRDTITYDEQRAAAIDVRVAEVGADGRLVVAPDGDLVRVGMLEKLLVPALAKLASFVPDGGIWLNTQRPEWNDANNALAGPGLSMVTLYHLRRYLAFVGDLVEQWEAARHVDLPSPDDAAPDDAAPDDAAPDDRGARRCNVRRTTIEMSASVVQWCRDVTAIIADLGERDGEVDDATRRAVLDDLARGGQGHRHRVAAGQGHDPVAMPVAEVRKLCEVTCAALDDTIAAGRRDDGLYHSYNRVVFGDDTAGVEHLGPMLEGQVAVLSSGTLDGSAVLAVVDALYDSAMYRADQDTFILYPATVLPAFLERNQVPGPAADRLRALEHGDGVLDAIVRADPSAGLHFRADLVNAKALERVLDDSDLDESGRAVVREVYEQVFDHASFTGRSGSMYGYEGLGSVYWHMVSKLLVAVQEAWWAALDTGESDQVVAGLAAAYRRVRGGLGFQKDPATFGAIPTDCYSHTPAHAGAQQPGMTGQVKEEVLTRFAELGMRVEDGRLRLVPGLIGPDDVVAAGTVGSFTLCGVPVSIGVGDRDEVVVTDAGGQARVGDGLALTTAQSRALFARAGEVERIDWTIGPDTMRAWTSAT